MSVRGDLRVGETLRGSLRKRSRSYTVMGRVVLKRRDQGGRRFVKREQWRLIDDEGVDPDYVQDLLVDNAAAFFAFEPLAG